MKKFFVAVAACCLAFSSFDASAQAKWKPLFGENLAEADYNPAVWSQKDGVLSAVKDESIWTKVEYENFELDLEFKTDNGTNSGVVVYCTDTKKWIPNSVEIQIADDYCDLWSNSDPTWKCGAVFGHLAANQERVVNRPGVWNRMRIKCFGQTISVELNGKLVTNMNMAEWTSGKINPNGTKIPDWLPKPFSTLPTKGKIGLQGKHGKSMIYFRNVDIKAL